MILFLVEGRELSYSKNPFGSLSPEIMEGQILSRRLFTREVLSIDHRLVQTSDTQKFVDEVAGVESSAQRRRLWCGWWRRRNDYESRTLDLKVNPFVS